MKKIKDGRKIGLALGGGAVLGAAHIGILKALEKNNISVNYLTGTSIGALIGALYAFGKTPDEIQQIALDIDWMDFSNISLSKYGLLSNEKISIFLEEQIGDVTFNEAKIPIAVVATDISNGQKVIISEGKIAEAVMASTALPGIFAPVEINDRLLVDGGIVENVPVVSLKEMGAEFCIAVDLNAKHSQKKPESILEVLLNTFDFTIMTATKLQTEEADLIIKPDLTSFNMVDTDQIEDLIAQGYSETLKYLEKVN